LVINTSKILILFNLKGFGNRHVLSFKILPPAKNKGRLCIGQCIPWSVESCHALSLRPIDMKFWPISVFKSLKEFEVDSWKIRGSTWGRCRCGCKFFSKFFLCVFYYLITIKREKRVKKVFFFKSGATKTWWIDVVLGKLIGSRNHLSGM
jgi:hypothetical protein